MNRYVCNCVVASVLCLFLRYAIVLNVFCCSITVNVFFLSEILNSPRIMAVVALRLSLRIICIIANSEKHVICMRSSLV